MRIIYLDEAGTGRLRDDPFLVVAGIILHADNQWLALERYLRDMADCVVPAPKRPGIIFHAKDIFHGTKAFHRNEWSKDHRFSILDELATLPKQFDFPIVWGAIDRREVAEKHPDFTPETQTEHAYLLAATMCLLQAEKYMRVAASESEVAQVVFEDRGGVRNHVKDLHRFLRGPDAGDDSEYLPLTRIIDTPNFAAKNESSPLQIADFCAFAIKRKQTLSSHWDRFYNPIVNQMCFLPKAEMSSDPSRGPLS